MLTSYKLSENNKTVLKQDFLRLLESLTDSLAENGKENQKDGFDLYTLNRRKF